VVNSKTYLTTKVSFFIANYEKESRIGAKIRRIEKVEKVTELVERMKRT